MADPYGSCHSGFTYGDKMNSPKILVMVFLLFASLPTSAQEQTASPPANQCSGQIRALNSALDKAEDPASPGQLEACIPAVDPAKNVFHLKARNSAAADLFGAAYQRYLAAHEQTDKIQSDLQSGGGNICGAGPKVKTDVQALTMQVVDALADMETQERAFSENEFAFYQQYSKRALALAKARISARVAARWSVRSASLARRSGDAAALNNIYCNNI